MVGQNVIVKNETDLHTHSAASLVQFVRNFGGKVKPIKGGKTANARSIFNIMVLGISQDAEVTVRLDDESEEENSKKLVEFIENLEDQFK